MSRWGLSTLRVAGGSATGSRGFRSRPTRIPSQRASQAETNQLKMVDDSCKEAFTSSGDFWPDEDIPARSTTLTWAQIASSTVLQRFFGPAETHPGSGSPARSRATSSTKQTPETFAKEVPSRQSALKLRGTLSLSNVSTLPYGQCSSRRLRILYYSVKACSQLHLLSSADFSSLICLLGAISVSEAKKPYRSVFGHALVEHMTTSSYHPCWELVKLVAQDKAALGMPLRHSDRYWLMRAHLAALEEPHRGEAPNRDSQAFLWARTHYREISRDVAHPDVHLAYLNGFLSTGAPDLMPEIVSALCDFLRWHQCVYPELQDILWQLVLRSSERLSRADKESILRAVEQRARRMYGDSDKPATDVSDCHKDVRALDLVEALRVAVFGSERTTPETRLDRQLSDWSLRTTARVLQPAAANEPESRWSALSLFALAASGSTKLDGSVLQTPSIPSTAAADWKVVCILASLERLFQIAPDTLKPFSATIANGLSHILDSLWSDWARTESDARPLVVARAICSSFLHLAGRLNNRLVRVTCQEYAARTGLWEVDVEVPRTVFGLRSLAEEHLFCAVACEVRVAHTLDAIVDRVGSRLLVSTVVSSCMARFAVLDAEVADELWTVARRAEVSVSAEALVVLADNLVQQGHGDRALDILADASISSSPEQQYAILRRMLQVFAEYGVRTQSPSFVDGVVQVLQWVTAHHLPPEDIRTLLQHVLIALVRAERGQEANAVVATVFRAADNYFQIGFLREFVTQLLDRRQFRAAYKCFSLIADALGEQSASLRELILHRYAQAGASALARTLPGAHPAKPSLSARLAKLADYQRVPTRMSTLKMPSLLKSSTAMKSSSAPYGVDLLSSSGRLCAAKSLYARLRAHQPSHAQTKMGNMILHAVMHRRRRRNGRQVRKVLRTLDELKAKYGFLPDRVTLNIVLKAILRWKTTANAAQLRALLDRLVANGYPSASGMPGETPFGTDAWAAPMPTIEIPQVTSPLSIARHVRPLYKMFIRAFHLRGDGEAAGVVVGMLKAARARADKEEKERDARRKAGGRRIRWRRSSQETRKVDERDAW